MDAKWSVPESYDVEDRAFALPPPQGYVGAEPLLGLLSIRALEDQATGDGQLALYAWQVMAGAGEVATQTIDRLVNVMDLGGLELLVLAHAYVATGMGEGAAFELAQRARKILKQPITEHSIDASLLLAVTALPYGVDRVRTLLDMLGPELEHGTPTHRAVHALIRAAIDPDDARLDDAHRQFTALDDQLGLAQCALVAYKRELGGAKRGDHLRGFLEHAIYRYDADGRPAWAARAISHVLVPLLVDELKAPPADVGEQLGRAAAFGVQARSQHTVEAVFRIATKLGYAASVKTLSQFDPPTFAKHEGTPAAATEPKPKKAPAKKPKKRA